MSSNLKELLFQILQIWNGLYVIHYLDFLCLKCMLKEIFNLVQSTLKTALSIEAVYEYKGEFEEGVDWDPSFPCVFIQADNPYEPMARSADNSVLKYKSTFTLYCGNLGTLLTMDMLETVIAAFDGVNYTVTTGDEPNIKSYNIDTHIMDSGAPLLAYVKGLGCIYELKIEIH